MESSRSKFLLAALLALASSIGGLLAFRYVHGQRPPASAAAPR